MDEPEGATEISVMFDWGTGPFWISTQDDPLPDAYGVDELSDLFPISDELVTHFLRWNEKMQGTYNDDDPASSGLTDPRERQDWIDEGIELTRRLKAEVGSTVRVEYRPFGKPVNFDAPP
ncbi:hypothetical protein [Saccharomonospora piscinae]|uniref:hypothetical protein n=1 Tax=Saccharomonospora piscinae TaxID=687388 RepID=UPI0004651871|nr:hypothetical protein [Saccharomonospora piscinae]